MDSVIAAKTGENNIEGINPKIKSNVVLIYVMLLLKDDVLPSQQKQKSKRRDSPQSYKIKSLNWYCILCCFIISQKENTLTRYF